MAGVIGALIGDLIFGSPRSTSKGSREASASVSPTGETYVYRRSGEKSDRKSGTTYSAISAGEAQNLVTSSLISAWGMESGERPVLNAIAGGEVTVSNATAGTIAASQDAQVPREGFSVEEQITGFKSPQQWLIPQPGASTIMSFIQQTIQGPVDAIRQLYETIEEQVGQVGLWGGGGGEQSGVEGAGGTSLPGAMGIKSFSAAVQGSAGAFAKSGGGLSLPGSLAEGVMGMEVGNETGPDPNDVVLPEGQNVELILDYGRMEDSLIEQLRVQQSTIDEQQLEKAIIKEEEKARIEEEKALEQQRLAEEAAQGERNADKRALPQGDVAVQEALAGISPASREKNSVIIPTIGMVPHKIRETMAGVLGNAMVMGGVPRPINRFGNASIARQYLAGQTGKAWT